MGRPTWQPRHQRHFLPQNCPLWKLTQFPSSPAPPASAHPRQSPLMRPAVHRDPVIGPELLVKITKTKNTPPPPSNFKIHCPDVPSGPQNMPLEPYWEKGQRELLP